MPRQNRVSNGSRPRMGNLGRDEAVTSNPERTLRLSQSGSFRSSILHECRRDFAAQVFCWDSTVNRFLFLVTMCSTSSDSEMSFDSEDSEIYYIAEDMRQDLNDDHEADLLASLQLTTQPPSLWPTKNGQTNTRRWMLTTNSNEH